MKDTTTLHNTPTGGFVMFTEDVSAEPGPESNYGTEIGDAEWEFYPDASF